ncbi:MAG: CRTAC1 family protein [Cytophagales bacterium]|nr:CRTAC1 family protein [Cytophagales bacterium]
MRNSTKKENYRPSKTVRIAVTSLFVVILAVPILLQYDAERLSPGKDNAEARKYALDVFGFYLEEVSDAAGVDFIHRSPALDSRIDHILPTIASTGASVSVADFNNDGWNDFYLTSSKYHTSNALYKNLGDGTFVDVADETGVGKINEKGTGVSMGSVWADIDNDGFEDIFIYKWGQPRLFLNQGGTGFRDITESAGFPAWINANSAIWFDYNNDGLVDLFIGGYYKEKINLWELENTLIMPESFEYANNGGRNYLLENKGNGFFEDVTFSMGLSSTKWTLAVGSIDFDKNGYQDLFIANDYSVDELYMNNGASGFEEVGKKAKIGYAPKSGMNVSFADVSNNSQYSIYVSNITEMGILLQGNNMWVPAYGRGGEVEFANRAGAMGIELGGWSYGSQFGDLNNDGYQDLYLANGYISAAKNNSYWYDYSKITGGNKAIISDALNWPAMEGRSQSGFQQNKVWVNSQSGIFADVTDYISDMPPRDSRAVALADLWNTGKLDVIVANQGKKVSVLKNHGKQDKNWISFQLEGTKSNRSAIGAQVVLEWEDQVQSQVVTGGIGFCSQNQRAIHFGIGASDHVNKVTVIWPAGGEQIITGLSINTTHRIVEEHEIN